jgi:threonylcarbamoyladenosine tRNA methylthiotransferase MtaB
MEIVLTGVNMEIMEREFGKKHEHTFLELVQELDKEGIERLQFRPLIS